MDYVAPPKQWYQKGGLGCCRNIGSLNFQVGVIKKETTEEYDFYTLEAHKDEDPFILIASFVAFKHKHNRELDKQLNIRHSDFDYEEEA